MTSVELTFNLNVHFSQDRVKAALQKEEEEKYLPRKRKRKPKNEGEENGITSDNDNDHHDSSDTEKPEEKKTDEKNKKTDKFRIPKKNVAAPPPIDFHSLLKLAEQKQHEPIVIEKNVEEFPDRPMTHKEKQEYLRERERKMRREMAANGIIVKEKEKTQKKPENLKATSKPVTSSNSLQKEEDTRKVPRTSNDSVSPSSGQKVKPSTASNESTKLKKYDVKETTSSSQMKTFVDRFEKSRESLPQKKSGNHSKSEASRTVTNPRSGQNEEKLSKDRMQKLSFDSDRVSNVERKISKEASEKLRESKLPKKTVTSKSDLPMKQSSGTSSLSARQFPPADVQTSNTKRSLKPQRGRQFPPPDIVRAKPKPVIKRK